MPGQTCSTSDRVRASHFHTSIVVLLAICSLLAIPSSAIAAATTMVDLGAATGYGVLSGASIGNTANAVGAPHTTIHGDLGVKVNTPPSGFPPGVVTGSIEVGTAAATEAHAAAVAAYAQIAARPGGAPLAGAMGGITVTPGLYSIVGAVSNTGTLTLDAGGDANAVFVFQVGGALAMAASSRVVLAGGAQASRVFWQVNGAGAVGANAQFVGTLIAMDAVALGSGTLMNGRAFARNGALTLDANEVYSGPPEVTIDGGSAAMTTDTTPTITGTTSIEAPAQVTVTINAQTLLVTPTAGAWSVTSGLLANASYPVVASVVDGADNHASAGQTLVVDTVLPLVAFDGGATRLTNDDTPTFSGTSDVAPGSIVHVSVGGQSLDAIVHTGGWWNITATALLDGTAAAVATVRDPAGNEGVSSQDVTVDTLAPVATLDGAGTALTNDPTPEISGAASGAEGEIVTVRLADQTLTGSVLGDGTWSVEASLLDDGPHRIELGVADRAGNASAATQVLTIDTVSPDIDIDGGVNSASHDSTPTITGTSGAAVGTLITVTVAGQMMTTVSQADRSWNVTPSLMADGGWSVYATTLDPAGNIGTATQVLTIATLVAPPPTPTPPQAPQPAVVTPTTGVTTPRTSTSANVSASVNPNGVATRYLFEYGTTTAYGRRTVAGDAGAGTVPVRAVATLTGLAPGMRYHYRLVITSVAGTLHGGDATFVTLRAKPRVVTSFGRAFAQTGATRRVKVKGRVSLPASVTAARGCRGILVVKVLHGAKVVATNKVRLSAQCAYASSTLARGIAGSGRLTLRVQFAGNTALVPMAARDRVVRYH